MSAVWGMGLLALGLVGRMWGREEVEWKDRSWRLLGKFVSYVPSLIISVPFIRGLCGVV